MTDSVLDGYRRLMNELLIQREAEGGDLPVEVESAYVERLDALWWQLSTDEQAEYEAELADVTTLTGPDALGLVDCDVVKGSHSIPRRAA